MLSASQGVPMNAKRIDRLFLQFGAFYGQLWRSQLKEENFIKFMKQQWQEALCEIDDRTFELAIKECRTNREFPPTLPQFVDMCRDIKRRHNFIRQVEKERPRNLEVAAFNLAKIKQQLNMKL